MELRQAEMMERVEAQRKRAERLNAELARPLAL